jgi:hypothetical protein
MSLTVTQLFAPTQLTTGNQIIYSVPSTPSTSVLKNGAVRFTNTSSAAVTVTAYACQQGSTPTAANAFANAESIAPNTHLDMPVPMLAAGGFIEASASAGTSVTMFALDGVLFS